MLEKGGDLVLCKNKFLIIIRFSVISITRYSNRDVLVICIFSALLMFTAF